jgi:hypothetical protein
MSDVAVTPINPGHALPKCPACHEQPIAIALSYLVFPQEQIGAMFYCSTCGAMLSVQAIGVQPKSNIAELMKPR